ncbi:uncharacterized protein LACBIDRAFT_313060 [Laccaria bicolor S238N-H82]|uniref:Predicted protein n=1 Tax=Laccaria bicolor (strain S238N-H82 / ATCC MYA-4686) TaxID=486041 RepID=B0DXF9_LACBS|nr:uncharacterized protein LACBIDRAFT_313060 [Laccaria bicolor S238N-H82]EDR00669.1 predicted protein [Laccaria bicolor S238N-H82]|eukprot:XP_001888678.1 predicted protein [Laccaria bicolor S238N-H82]
MHLDPVLPPSTQLHLLNLFGGDDTPYESLHAVVSYGVKSWFDAFVATRPGAGKDAGGGSGGGEANLRIPTPKKIAELELRLLQLHQNVYSGHEFDDSSCSSMGPITRPATQQPHIPSMLRQHVPQLSLMAHQRRVKAIQAATKLTRDVSSDTASQAVNFWSSLESALEGIEAQVKCKEVRMVMDALRNAKRFHVTVSVIADTELKGATDHVHKCNRPLNNLLSSTTSTRCTNH